MTRSQDDGGNREEPRELELGALSEGPAKALLSSCSAHIMNYLSKYPAALFSSLSWAVGLGGWSFGKVRVMPA